MTLAQKNEYDKMTFRAQVIKISDPAKVGKGLTEQEFTIECTCSRSTGRIHRNNYTHVRGGTSVAIINKITVYSNLTNSLFCKWVNEVLLPNKVLDYPVYKSYLFHEPSSILIADSVCVWISSLYESLMVKKKHFLW